MKFVALAMAALLATAGAARAVDFSRDVRPIFAANCLKCHGIDDKARKSKLRVDDRQTATAPAKSGKVAIVPGKPDSSELIRRVFSGDADERMPPASTHLTLSESQKQILRQWIAEGAKYQTHWAFMPPRQAPLPSVRNPGWAKNPIDRFVLAKLESMGLHPSPEVDRYALVRRVYLDLIGLPPTPQEAQEFVDDPRPDAYERLVDKLLASPQYGERWARRWLDLARYADTNGFEKDRPRTIWPYRDWVINALNADMPFDEFTIEQIAGDMLPHATAAQQIATGFHRNTMLNEEGGIDPLEYRFYASIDRINTTGTAWLGLTVGCAQCHTHKFDPITQKEYYSLMVFLNNADEPQLEISDLEVDRKRSEIEKQIAELTATLLDKWPVEDRVIWRQPQLTVTTMGDLEFEADGEPVDRVKLEVTDSTSKSPINFGEIKISVTSDSAPSSGTPGEAEGGSPAQLLYKTASPTLPRNTGGGRVGQVFVLNKPVGPGGGLRWQVELDPKHPYPLDKIRLSVGRAIPDSRPLEVRRREAMSDAFAAWEKQASTHAVKWQSIRPDSMQSSKPFLTVLDDDSILAGGDIVKSCAYDLTFHGDFRNVTAVRLEALPDDSLPGHGPGMTFYEGENGDFFLSTITLTANGNGAKFSKASQTFGSPASDAIDTDPQTGWAITGGTGKAQTAVFSLANSVGSAKELKLHMLFERYFAAPLGHFRISVTSDPGASEPQARPTEIEQILTRSVGERSQDEQQKLMTYFLSIAPELADARKEIDRLRQTMPPRLTTLVMRERPASHPRQTFVHHRGEFLQTEDAVEPGVPAFLPPLPRGQPANRLTFARWLVSRDNPLTARVQVNRQWAAFFGRGIVRTAQDFGFQGELPSNQELLDWLAVEFMNEGWSLKKLDRLIVTSATYRQSSNVTPELLARDPENVLLARGPRFREEAEIVRDSALRASGLLSERIGGPSVFPPQPASITTEGAYGALKWKTSTGPDRYRRSLYTFSKRTAPFALYQTFDAPGGEVCVARREVSDSPLQALSVLNDQVFLEAAQAMGRHCAECDEDDAARAREIFCRLLVRPPDSRELAMVLDFARSERERLGKEKENAARLAGEGKGDVVERATWTAVARAVMNLDEAVTKD
jgi:hypothetical protein